LINDHSWQVLIGATTVVWPVTSSHNFHNGIIVFVCVSVFSIKARLTEKTPWQIAVVREQTSQFATWTGKMSTRNAGYSHSMYLYGGGW